MVEGLVYEMTPRWYGAFEHQLQVAKLAQAVERLVAETTSLNYLS
jgi:hypothetical protein